MRHFLFYFAFLVLFVPIGHAQARSKPRIVFMIGEDEYKTWETLPEFGKTELATRGFVIRVIQADPLDKNNFPGLVAALREADLLFISLRRRAPFKEQLEAVRQHLNAGKPLVGIRTACHAFAPTGPDREKVLSNPALAEWPAFDPEVLGGHYTGHYGAGEKVVITLAAGASGHPILDGIQAASLQGNGSLYKVSPLAPTSIPLLFGSWADKPPEPVAWTTFYGPKKARIFYTSLGHPDDFKNPQFRRLLINAIRWGCNLGYGSREPWVESELLKIPETD
jgi:type 1 glutamine amidotransferase